MGQGRGGPARLGADPPAAALSVLAQEATAASTGLEPTPFAQNEYQGQLLGGDYDPGIPTPDAILGFPVGQRTATPAQIAAAVNAWSDASERAMAVEYARSHENRPLYYVMISSPGNLARVAEVKDGIARLADPAGLSAATSSTARRTAGRLIWQPPGKDLANCGPSAGRTSR